jgi:PAS domain S-box-containing protein
MGMAIVWSVVRIGDSRQALDSWRAHSLEAIIAADGLETKMLDRQRIARGYVMMGTSEFLRGYDSSAMQEALWDLERVVRDDAPQRERVRALRPIVIDVAMRTDRSRMLVDGGQRDVALRIMSTGAGDGAMTRAKDLFSGIVEAERSSLARRQEEVARVDRLSEVYVYVISLFGASLLIIAGAAGWHLVLARSRLREGQLSQRLDDEIRSSEERMRIAHEATGAGTWELDVGSGTLLWSPEMFALYGRRTGRVMTVDEWMALIHGDDVACCFFLGGNLRAGKEMRQEFRIDLENGDQRWISSRAHVVKGDAGLRVIGMDVDVTEQREMSARLEVLNRMLAADADEKRRERETMFDRSKDLMCIARGDGSLLSVNPAWEAITGYTEKELLGRLWIDLIVAEDRDRALESTARLSSGEAVSRLVTRVEARDGRVVWLDWTLVPETGSGRLYGVARDITEATENEERLRDTEQQLQQMQKMEAVGQLTGGIAHDFNNMLTPIVGNLDLIARRHPDDERTLRMVTGARQSADRASTLVSRLLSFARKQHLDPQTVDVVSLVRGMEDLISRALGPMFEVAISAEDAVGSVKVDPNAFENALLNLSVNAKDAMPEGGPLVIDIARRSLTRAADQGRQPGRYVVVSVRDTGHGMDEETMRRAIEPFYTTKDMGKGTGLGLSMVHGMAAQSGGGLVLESRPGVGTVAAVWLPVVDEAVHAEAKPAVAAATAAARPLKILVVDDEPLVRQSVSAMLEDAGHEVVAAECGIQALQILRDGDGFDMLVTDHLMPGMTGLQLIEQVRAARPGMKVLLVTGYSQMDEDPSVPRLGKPFSAAGMAEAVDRAMRADNVLRMPARRTA